MRCVRRCRRAHHCFFGPECMNVRTNVPAALGIGNGGAEQFGPGQFSMIAVHRGIGLERCRHADRLIADVVHIAFENEAVAVASLALDQRLPHLGAHGRRRRRMEIIIGVDLLCRQVSRKAAKAGNAAHERVDDGLNQCGCDSGIDGVAAGGQNIPSRFRGLRLRGYNHALIGHGVLQCGESVTTATRSFIDRFIVVPPWMLRGTTYQSGNAINKAAPVRCAMTWSVVDRRGPDLSASGRQQAQGAAS